MKYPAPLRKINKDGMPIPMGRKQPEASHTITASPEAREQPYIFAYDISCPRNAREVRKSMPFGKSSALTRTKY